MGEGVQNNVRVDVFYSTQSAYCYFLLDRLLDLARTNVEVCIRPVLGAVLRVPERYVDRDETEAQYFTRDTARVAEFLNLPYADPDPSPIRFKPGSIWRAEEDQPLNQRLNRLYVGACRQGLGLSFLDHVGRMLWDGSTPGWDQGTHLAKALSKSGLNLERTLADVTWDDALRDLNANAEAMLAAGHWGVPLMVYQNEPFYGQDRFDHLLWRLKRTGVLPC